MVVPNLQEMYGSGADYLGRLPIFEGRVERGRVDPNEDGPLNYGYWQGIDWKAGSITSSQRRLASDNLIRLVARQLAIQKEDKILEVGHGTGYGARLVFNENHPQKIFAIDQSPDQVLRAQRTTLDHDQGTRISFRQGIAEQLDFPGSQFNGIYSVESAQHFVSFRHFTREAYRTLVAGGRISLCAFWMSKSGGLQELKELLPTIESGVDNPIPITEAADHLRAAGFGQIETRAIGDSIWYPLVAFCEQVSPEQTWSRNWIKGYEAGLIDYYLVSGQK